MAIHGRIAKALSMIVALAAPLAVSAQNKRNIEQTAEAVPGQYLVRLKDSSLYGNSMALQALAESVRAHILRVYPAQGFAVLQKPVVQTPSSASQDLKASPEFEFIEANSIFRISRIGNDPDLDRLWGLRNQGQADPGNQIGLSGVDIDAERAWDVTTGSPEVVVAVIDTGIDYTHPDLVPNLWVNSLEAKGLPGVDDDGNGIVDDIYGANFVDPRHPTGDPRDDQGHGSHCSGTIGARGNDGRGIVGVAWDVKIMGVKFLDANGSGTLESAILAIDYATQKGAQIESNSWAGGSYSQLLKEAIERANRAGVLFVAASSNSSGDNDLQPVYPANYEVDNVISVAAVDNRGELADFSNFGKRTVHVAAPGVNIWSSTKGGKYTSLSGTSMATPHVAGVAALTWAAFTGITHHEVKDRILAGARPLASLRNKVSTGGLVNAYYALTGLTPPPDPRDPSKWTHQPLAFSTPHPYPAKLELEYEVQISGAQEISLYFSTFQTERFYDVLFLYDRNGNELARVSGLRNDSYSPVISGDYVRLVFRSDDSIQDEGIELTAVAYR